MTLTEQHGQRDLQDLGNLAQIADRLLGKIALDLAQPSHGPAQIRRQPGQRQPARLAQGTQIRPEGRRQ